MNNPYNSKLTRPGALRSLAALWIVLMLLLALRAVQAQFNYVITNGTITITGYTGPGGALTLPDMISGLPVTSIGNEAFAYCTSLTGVTLPNSFTNIGVAAFWRCTSLGAIAMGKNNPAYSSVDGVLFNKPQTTLVEFPGGKAGAYLIPNTVTSIADLSFSFCTSLTSITIPNGVTSIGYETFWNCSSLTTITIPDTVASIGAYAFSGCSSVTNIAILTNVTRIPDAAFSGCFSLTSVTIPNSVTDIGNEAFSYCFDLTTVTIPNSVTNIGTNAFSHGGLTLVTIGDGVTSIQDGAFSAGGLNAVIFQGNAPSLGSGVFNTNNTTATVYYMPGTAGWGPTFGGLPTKLWNPETQFSYTTTNGTITITGYTGPGPGVAVTIPDTINGVPVTNIGDDAFFGGYRLSSVAIPNSVTNIGNDAFANCGSLTSVTIPNSLVRIGTGAFGGCGRLTSVTIPNSVVSIGDSAFVACMGLTNVTIGSGATSIGDGAFGLCTSLPWISVDTLNSAYSSLDGVLFNKTQTTLIQCPGAKAGSYTIPNGVTTIGDWAFANCPTLQSVTIPNSVTSIADHAFWNTGLTNVTIGSGASSIGVGAFGDCTSLSSISVDPLNSAYSSLDGVLFNKTQTALVQYPAGIAATSYMIPNGAATIGHSAFAHCTNLTSVTIPNSVTRIADYAFWNSSSLTNVTIGNGVTSIESRAFIGCASLLAVYFQGNAPGMVGEFPFDGDNEVTVYYLPGTTGWGMTFGDRPTAEWQSPPPGPWTLSATSVSTNSATLNAIVNPNGWPTTAWFQWGTTSNYGSLTSVADLGSGTAAVPLSAPLAGLTLGITYHFRIAATNNNGLAYGSDQSFTTAVLPPPEAYTSSASAVARTNATLNGMVNPNGQLTTAWFQWGTTTTYGNLTPATGMGSGTNATALATPLVGLIANTTYHFQAVASNSSGVVYGDDQSFSTWGLLQVSTLSATAVTPTNATLSGTVNPDGWPTTAWFEWGTTTSYGNFTPVTSIGSGTVALAFSAPLAGLTPGLIYHFRTAATNIAGVVYGSDQSFITTAPTFTDAKWVSLGFGINGNVNALAVSGTNLYAGGFFATAGGVTVNGIVKWDGSAWWALGSGMSRAFACSVDALALSGINLYASGFFGTAGGVPANNIAKWNGSAWSALGSGLDGRVYAIAVIGTDLYAGGGFITAGGMSAYNVAKWDGHAWSALGSGLGGGAYYANVRALALSGTNLYAGGFFTTAGGVSANYIAKWDGRAWSALGSGLGGSFLNPQVAALAVNGTDLYAGGDFTTAGGVTVNGIAKWTGSAWSALGPGMNSTVYALAMDGTDLYAGGQFTTAGGLSAANIAKWDGSAWSALGSGLSTSVYALAADGRGHLFVGGAFIRAGNNACLYLAQANLGSPPAVLTSPQTQTAETSAAVNLAVNAAGDPPPFYQWYFNGTKLLSWTSSKLVLTNILFSQSGTYMVVLTNRYGAVTSAPVILEVIPTVERSPVPGLQLMGQAGGLLKVEAANPLGPMPDWLPLDTVTLAGTPQYYFDLTVPLPPQRFYRAWQAGTPGVIPSLDLHLVPAIALAGSTGRSVRVDAINQYGPTDAWFNLDTVTLTNTTQLYFDVSAPGHPPRLYRIVPSP